MFHHSKIGVQQDCSWSHMDWSFFSLGNDCCSGLCAAGALQKFSKKCHFQRQKYWSCCSSSRFGAKLLTEVLGMSDRVVPLLVLCMCLTVGSVQSQGSQDAFIIQYLERRLAQMEVNDCCTSYDIICIHQADSTITSMLIVLPLTIISNDLVNTVCNTKNIFCCFVLLCVRFSWLTSYPTSLLTHWFL